LILRKIIKIVATICQILRLKLFDFGWGSAPDSAGGAYSAPRNLQLDFRGLLLRVESGSGGESKGREVTGGERR